MVVKEIKDKLYQIRNELYDELPIKDVSAFDLINRIRTHIKKLDYLISCIENDEFSV